jgi:hypothetical protein
VVLLTLVLVIFQTADRFLAVQHPLGRGVLVVEAWVGRESVLEASRLFQSGKYSHLVVEGSMTPQSESHAETAVPPEAVAAELIRLGIPAEQISVVGSADNGIARTYNGARAVKDWLKQSTAEQSVCCIEVFSLGAHARKSWLAYRRVFEPDYQVGIVAARETQYQPGTWKWSERRFYLVARNLFAFVAYKIWIRESSAEPSSSPLVGP